jgi:integrase
MSALLRTGVRYRYLYQTRHTFASRLLAGGEQELLVAKLLGHATVETVRKSYGRYISQAGEIVLRGDYSSFGADLGQIKPGKSA